MAVTCHIVYLSLASVLPPLVRGHKRCFMSAILPGLVLACQELLQFVLLLQQLSNEQETATSFVLVCVLLPRGALPMYCCNSEAAGSRGAAWVTAGPGAQQTHAELQGPARVAMCHVAWSATDPVTVLPKPPPRLSSPVGRSALPVLCCPVCPSHLQPRPLTPGLKAAIRRGRHKSLHH